MGILEVAEWGKAHANFVGSNGRSDGFDDVQRETAAVFDIATVLICALVDIVIEELIREITVCASTMSVYNGTR